MFFPETRGYRLFADSNDNEPYLYRGGPGDARPLKWLPPVDESQRYVFDHPISGDPRSIGYTRAEPPKWMHGQPLRVTGLVLTPGRLFVAGPPDVVVPGDSLAAFEGRAGGKLRVVRTSSGETLREYDLPSPPVFDGLIAAYGRLYLATLDGRITCMGK